MSDYYMIQRQYENRAENDSSALPLVAKYIRKAKSEKNDRRLFQGYIDARVFSPKPQVKLKYSDSAIYVARMLKDEKLLSSAYLSKGVIYYFNFKKYKLALDEFLRAYDYNKTNKDPYYRNKIIYFIGVVKSYIGYYGEALRDFKEARNFFEGEIKKDIHPNLMFSNQRGYYNILHQMAVCYRNLDNFQAADSIVSLGLTNTWKNADYKQEYSYFLKEQGINRYHQKDYSDAIEALQNSLPELKAINDFAWITISYAYLGKSKWRLGNFSSAIEDFNKVDSIVNKHSFVLPDARSVYEILIEYYAKEKNTERSLYYTQQLIKVDRVLQKDFIYLSSKIHRDYDTKELLHEATGSVKRQTIIGWLSTVVIFISLFVGFYLLLRYRSRKRIYGRNKLLGINLGGEMQNGTYRIRQYTKSDMDSALVHNILDKLEEFEKELGFRERGIQLVAVAEKFNVSQRNLSLVINEYKEASFTRYISELRIAYITEKLNKEPKFLKYTLDTLANECGIASRSNFSNLFHEINGIRPTEFIKRRLKEMELDHDKS
ncbi:helix-turn-helix domain-containing protein [Elizabethkingia ursingii]|uniref:helix-turn-helix domain-containing protein n=1 Tax=Elizabethkingia ursingii TaxID=1756150 RepID=UPI00201109B5|nr:helix-turn-helix domain-containing protein [Elizabethkingia ursingii]MCL1666547.1 helix-turn-helix domain-containing protein [Elizabethkingia ursingii]